MTLVLVFGCLYSLQRSQPAQPGHVEIEEKDVGLVLPQDFQNLQAIIRLRDDNEIFLQAARVKHFETPSMGVY
jgi:hypothetical protein